MTIYRYDGHILKSADGHIANSADCCCGEPAPCGCCDGSTLVSDCATGTAICGFEITISGFPALVYVETSSVPGSIAGEQWYDCTVLNQTVTIKTLGTASSTFLGSISRVRRKLIFAQACNATPNLCDTGSGYCCSADFDAYLYYDGACGFAIYLVCAGDDPIYPSDYTAWSEACSGVNDVCSSLGKKWTNKIFNACGLYTIEEPSTDWFADGCGTPSDDPADPGLAVTLEIYKKALTSCV